jgi:hypothetical protein
MKYQQAASTSDARKHLLPHAACCTLLRARSSTLNPAAAADGSNAAAGAAGADGAAGAYVVSTPAI